MASGGNYFTIPGVVATATFAAKQYYIVKASSTAGEVKVADTKASDHILGIIQNDAIAAQEAEVACVGVCKAAAETSVAYGDALTTSSTGRVKATTVDGDQIVGIALEASSAAGDIISVLLSLYKFYEA